MVSSRKDTGRLFVSPVFLFLTVLDIELDRRRANSVPRLVSFFTVFMSKPGLLSAEGRGFESHPGQNFSLSSCVPIFLPRGNAQLAFGNLPSTAIYHIQLLRSCQQRYCLLLTETLSLD